jgi:hypothetical protein
MLLPASIPIVSFVFTHMLKCVYLVVAHVSQICCKCVYLDVAYVLQWFSSVFHVFLQGMF